MCFSAGASFVASGGLALAGGASLAIAKKEYKFLAAIPLMFATQQALEGVQWIHLNNGFPSLMAGYSFAFFAYIVWPVYIPVLVYLLDRKKCKVLKYFIFLGSAVGFYFLFLLLTHPLHINEIKSCIQYDFNVPLDHISGGAYLLAIFAPLFVSSRRVFKILGVVTAISMIIASLLFSFAFASVWCFFAAIISSLIFVYIKMKSRKAGKI